MRRTNALQEYLEETTRRYNNGESLNVEWANQPHVSYDEKTGEPTIFVSPNVRKWIGKDVSNVQEIRCILDDLNHEVEHPRRTPKDAKKKFMEEYPDCPKSAGQVWNTYEDVYIDSKRTSEWRGLRKTRAFLIEKIMENHHRHGRVDNMDDDGAALLEGILQVTHAGFVKGIENMDKEKKEFFAFCRQKAKEIQDIGGNDEESNIRDESIGGDGYYEERRQLIESVMEHFIDLVPDASNAEDYAEDMNTPSGTLPDNLDIEQPPSETEDDQSTQNIDGYSDEEGEESKDNAEKIGESTDNDEKENEESGGESADGIGSESQVDSGEIDNSVPEIDPTLTEGHIEDMERMDDDRSVGEWFGLSEDVDYHTPDERFKERYYEIERRKNWDNSDIMQKIRKRDDMIKDTNQDYIREELEKSGLADEIQEAFEELITRDRWVPAKRGQRIHKRNAIRYVAGDYTEENIYQHKRRAEIGDRAVSVALDMSGSMPEKDAKVALAALQQAIDIIGDQFTACGYKTFSPKGTGKKIITTPLITAPTEDFKMDHLGAVWSGGTTPTPSGIKEAANLLKECSKREDVLIVITDGAPNVTSDGKRNEDAVSESREVVRNLKSEGVKVIGLGVGSVRKQKMDEIFEGDYIMTNMDNLAGKLVEIYRRQMNTV